ncbi:hypothetical protein NHX12_003848 [Muraenolepis orangiensis]|uniref:Uncharacterized protein n=1 Tax=Muraenolepis orangiensis TaxID=630683 RepID=A0A9Q0DVN3_9TELE|nr:hypothetical protein NHX12_003848 [Muraenolepis orangiensis]
MKALLWSTKILNPKTLVGSQSGGCVGGGGGGGVIRVRVSVSISLDLFPGVCGRVSPQDWPCVHQSGPLPWCLWEGLSSGLAMCPSVWTSSLVFVGGSLLRIGHVSISLDLFPGVCGRVSPQE